MIRHASVTVDLDPLRCYLRNRGLRAAPESNLNAVYDDGLPRLLQTLARHGIPATFFVVGEDAERADNAALLREAAEHGHELASHSHTHPHDIASLGVRSLKLEVELAELAIGAATGQPVRGFRSPSWNVSEQLFAILSDREYRYDSSLVPLPRSHLWAWLPRLAPRIFGGTCFAGQSRWPGPPDCPYPMDLRRPWSANAASPLWEVPNGLTGGRVPLPLNFTALALLGDSLEQRVARLAARRVEPLVLVLHGLDLVDYHAEIRDPRLRGKPGLMAPLSAKQARIDRLLRTFGEGREWIRLDDLVASAERTIG